jgi:hypothetical protein
MWRRPWFGNDVFEIRRPQSPSIAKHTKPSHLKVGDTDGGAVRLRVGGLVAGETLKSNQDGRPHNHRRGVRFQHAVQNPGGSSLLSTKLESIDVSTRPLFNAMSLCRSVTLWFNRDADVYVVRLRDGGARVSTKSESIHGSTRPLSNAMAFAMALCELRALCVSTAMLCGTFAIFASLRIHCALRFGRLCVPVRIALTTYGFRHPNFGRSRCRRWSTRR